MITLSPLILSSVEFPLDLIVVNSPKPGVVTTVSPLIFSSVDFPLSMIVVKIPTPGVVTTVSPLIFVSIDSPLSLFIFSVPISEKVVMKLFVGRGLIYTPDGSNGVNIGIILCRVGNRIFMFVMICVNFWYGRDPEEVGD